jgi:hypothetical protein
MVMAFHAPVDEQGRDLCARCCKVLVAGQWERVDDAAICPGCITYEEVRMVNARRRLRGLPERPVGPELPAL